MLQSYTFSTRNKNLRKACGDRKRPRIEKSCNPALFENNPALFKNNPALFENNPALFNINLALIDNTPRVFLIIPRVFLFTPKEKQDFAATLLPPIFPLNRAFDAIWWQGGSKI
jgi:hypothetical protein